MSVKLDVYLTIKVNGQPVFGPLTGQDMYFMAKYAGYENDGKGAHVQIHPPLDFLGIMIGRTDRFELLLEPTVIDDSRTARIMRKIRAFRTTVGGAK